MENSTTTLAICYTPTQKMTELYDLHSGIMAGTIFPELDLPFYMGGVRIAR